MDPIDSLEACLRRAATRLRLRRALQAAVFAGIGTLALHALITAGVWLGHELAGSGNAPGWPKLASALPLIPVLAGALAAAWPVAELPLLRSIDRAHRLADLLSSAWEFRALEPAKRTQFMRATLARSAEAIGRIHPARALDDRRPRGLGWLAGLGVTSLLLQLLPWQPSAAHERVGELGSRAGVRARVPAADGGVTANAPPVPQVLLSAAELASRRASLVEREPAGTESEHVRAELGRLLDRLEAGTIDRLAALRTLSELEARLDAAAIVNTRTGQELAALAGTLAARAPTRALAARLRAADLAAAQAELERYTRALRENALDPRQLESLRAALEEARARRDAALPARATTAGQGFERSASGPLAADGGPASRPQSAAPATPSADSPPARELERLERALDGVERALAAHDSMRAADSFEQGQRELERLERERAGAPRGKALAEQIAQLRDSMRRGPRSERGAQAPGGSTASAAAGGAAQGEAAPAAEVAGGPTLRTTTGDEPTPAPRTPTRIAATENAGPTRSELIRAAASGGFVDPDYATVHAEYAKHAERELGREVIPPGYRVQVRRYFQTIGPRPKTTQPPKPPQPAGAGP